MRNARLLLTLGLAATANAAPPASAPSADYRVQPVPFTKVHVADEFWSPRLETNRTVTIPYAFTMCEETGRIDNFAVAGKLKEGQFRGIFFNDSDVFKVIEGAAYALAIQPDPKLDAYLDDLIAKIAAAQEPDGYLYTCRTIATPGKLPPGGAERWSDLRNGHELYNVGHLYEAAVAHFQATGKRTLLDVALKNADLVCQVFGPGRNTGPCGHPEVEIGLVKLYRATGAAKYLQMARFFIATRGRADGRKLYGEYAQDHQPLAEQRKAVGHAVRAAYLYAGATDVAALTPNVDYAPALAALWQDVVGAQLYLTGGIGAKADGEAFGADYELPNATAYAETCAAIANALWNYRLFLMTGDAQYVDVVERVIYNGFLAGVALEGNRFFYPNPLEAPEGAERAPWFDCACCPANVARFLPSIPGYAYARRDREIFVNLFIGGRATIELPGAAVAVQHTTRYPWDGAVKLIVNPKNAPAEFTLRIRIPGWAREAPVPSDLYRYSDRNDAQPVLRVNGAPAKLEVAQGYATLTRTWEADDAVELELPMPVRRVVANPRVTADAGRVALERGPLVYCVEGVDQPDRDVRKLTLPDDLVLRTEFRPDLLRGVLTIRGVGRDFLAIPYYAWAHRGRCPMTVWLPRNAAAPTTSRADAKENKR